MPDSSSPRHQPGFNTGFSADVGSDTPVVSQTLDLPTPHATLDLPANMNSPSATLTFAGNPPGANAADLSTETGPGHIGRFVLRRRLGEGAFGEVFLAYDPRLDREVALKLAKPGALETPERRTRFFREAKASANLRHPNIVPLFEAGWENQRCFIASAYIPGTTLEALIEDRNKQSSPLSPAEAARITRTLADALAYAHAQGIVHRDVKPQNIMMDEAGQPLLLDFGLAARAEAGDEKLTQEGAVMGTPAYMAPEQIGGQGVAASDQYSLGCALYQMLTGRTPFEGGPIQQMCLHKTEPVPAPRRSRPAIPRDLETICLKMLEKPPGQRYAGCAEVAEDLRRFLATEPILARPAGMVERAAKWARRRPRDAALVLAAGLVLGVGALGGVIYGLYADQQTRVLRQQTERRRQADILRTKGQDADGEGRQALARNDPAAALRHLTDAEAAMGQALALLAASREPEDEAAGADITQRLESARQLARKITADQSEIRQIQSAAEQLAKTREELFFRHLSVVAGEQAENRRVIAKLAPVALAPFGLDPSKPDDPAKPPLAEFAGRFSSPEQFRQIARWCCEVLFVWAAAEEEEATGAPSPAKEAGLRRAVRLLDLAAGVSRSRQAAVPPMLRQRRESLLAKIGETPPTESVPSPTDSPREESALDHFITAAECFRHERTGEAIRHCETAAKLEPGYFWPTYLQGLCCLRDRKWPMAEALLTACVTQRPELAWPRILRAAARMGQLDFDGADADLKAAESETNLPPTACYLALLTRSQYFIARRKWSDARGTLQRAITLRPDGGYQAHANLAEVCRQSGDLPACLTELDQAVRLEPGHGQLLYTRARARREAGDIPGATQDFGKAIAAGRKGDEWLASARVERGYLKHQAGDKEGALADYDAALALTANYAPAHRQRAETLLSLGRHAEAGRALDEFIAAANPTDPEPYRARGLIHASRQEYPEAVFAYTRALRLKNDPQVLNYRGWAHLQAQSLPPALADFEAVLKAKPDYADALCGRAQILAAAGRVVEALADVEKALKSEPKPTPSLLRNLAIVYVRAFRFGPPDGEPRTVALYQDRAVELLTRAAELTPEAGRVKFWKDQVAKDATLNELLNLPEVARLARRHGW